MDGYSGLLRQSALRIWVREKDIQMLVVGLGAGKQEEVAAEAASEARCGLLLTCGGYLDQISQPNYYPRWAYPLRLNWLVRIAREPRRLIRRYTADAWLGITKRRELRSTVSALAGYKASNDLIRRCL